MMPPKGSTVKKNDDRFNLKFLKPDSVVEVIDYLQSTVVYVT